MITFDPAKDQTNRDKHGISLAEADFLDWAAALTWEDGRKDYGEIRLVALAPMADRLYCCVYVEREEAKRIISLRKANQREVMDYAAND
ncbi:MAG: BrnT family toxin [Azonexus sp.]|nr:BrnT family toxin [Azonexus sp.]